MLRIAATELSLERLLELLSRRLYIYFYSRSTYILMCLKNLGYMYEREF
jgi:hypothetical protein